MKYLVFILLLFSFFIGKAQNNPSGFPTQANQGWTRWGWSQSDSGTIIAPRMPNFTPRYPGTTILYQEAGVDTSLNYWTGLRWIKIQTRGFDSTSLSNRINLKLNISDTVGQWLSQNSRLVDTMYRVNDSTVGFKIKGTAYTFQILGRSPSGGGSGLTSIGLSMPSAFTVTNSPLTSNGTISVSGAGTASQYMRGNGTLATTDTGMIPNFYLKSRSLLSGTSPITYNSTTGAIGIQNANTSGTKGAATFLNSDFSDNGFGLISLTTLVSPGSCTNCTVTFGADGRAQAYSNGVGPTSSVVDTIYRVPGKDSIFFTINSVVRSIKDSVGAGGSFSNNNVGGGFRWVATPTGNIKTAFSSNTILLDSSSNSNGITIKADTSVLATQYDLTQVTVNTQQSVTGNGLPATKINLVNDQSSTTALGEEYLYGFDSLGIRGFQRNKYIVSKAYEELRGLRSGDTSIIYRSIINGFVADFYWDANSTATDDSVMIIKLHGVTTGRLLRYYDTYIMVDWFGAIANDANDDSYYIQKAINFAIAAAKGPEVRFSGGNYIMSNVNIVKSSGIQYTFVTLKISGQSFLVTPATVITVNNANGFGFMIQTARNVEISNITFVGQSPIPNFNQTITWANSDWTTGVRDNINSPHAGIVIDGYHSSVISGNRYPGMSSFYTNTQTGGSSQVTITNCAFKRFVTAIMENPSAAVANGDNIKAQGCYFETNKIAWACGQTQSRDNSIENCYFLFHQFIIDGISYGAQQGTPPNVSTCNFAGATKYLYVLNGAFSSLTFSDCYSESLFSLGKSNANPVEFINCQNIFNHDNSIFTAPHIAEGDQVTFVGGRIGYFDNLSNMIMPFNVKNLSFNGVSMLGLPVNMDANYFNVLPNKTVYDNASFIGTGQIGVTWESNTYNGSDLSNMFGSSPIVMPGAHYVLETTTFRMDVQSKSPKINATFIESKTLNIDTLTSSAYFKSSTPSAYQINDILTTASSVIWSGNDGIFTTTPTVVGEVYAINVDTVFIKYVPYGLNESTSYSLVITRIPHASPMFFGDVSSGSNSITNCHFGLITPAIGDWINSDYFPAATRITNVSGATVTVSQNATGTTTGTQFKDANMYVEAKAADPTSVSNQLGFSVGDIIINSRFSPANDTVAYWICKTPGFSSTTPVAQFSYVRTGDAPLNITFNNVGASPNSAGASISGNSITLQPANSSNPGVMSAVSQDFSGTKNFIGDLSLQTTATNNSGRAALSLWGNPGARRSFLISHGTSYPDPDLDSTTVLLGSGTTPFTALYMITGAENLFLGNFSLYNLSNKKVTVGGTTAFQDKVYLNVADSTSSPANMVWQDPSTKELKIAAISGATTIYNGNGTLSGDRNVSSGGFTLRVEGANNSDTLMSIINTGTTSTGLYVSGSALGINVVSGSGAALQAFGSTKGAIITGDTDEGLLVKSNAVRGARIQTVPSSSNTAIEVLQLERGVSGGPGADGIGEYISFLNKTSSNSSDVCNTLVSKFTNATTATRTSQFSITGMNSASSNTVLTLDGDGTMTTVGRRIISVAVSSAGTLTLGNSHSYVFSGTTTTWTLPSVSGNTGVIYFIKNRGSGNITLNSSAGGNDIYDTSATSTITIAAGASKILQNDGSFWLAE